MTHRMSENLGQSVGERVVRVNALETRLQNFRGEMGVKIDIAIRMYDAVVITPMLQRLTWPWYVRLWYGYLRPVLELYGLPPVELVMPKAPQVVRSESPEQGQSLIATP